MGWLKDVEKLADDLEKLSVEKRLSIVEEQIKDIAVILDKIANHLNDIDRN
jgi:hypothetical protein